MFTYGLIKTWVEACVQIVKNNTILCDQYLVPLKAGWAVSGCISDSWGTSKKGLVGSIGMHA